MIPDIRKEKAPQRNLIKKWTGKKSREKKLSSRQAQIQERSNEIESKIKRKCEPVDFFPIYYWIKHFIKLYAKKKKKILTVGTSISDLRVTTVQLSQKVYSFRWNQNSQSSSYKPC